MADGAPVAGRLAPGSCGTSLSGKRQAAASGKPLTGLKVFLYSSAPHVGSTGSGAAAAAQRLQALGATVLAGAGIPSGQQVRQGSTVARVS